MGGGSRGTADDDGDNVDGYSRHVVLCDGRIIAGPCSSEGASGYVNFIVITTITALFVLSYAYVAKGIWLTVAPALYMGCWVVLYFAAYCDPGVLPRRWQILDNPTKANMALLDPTHERHPFCRTCKIYRPPDSHHCRVCDACVAGFDHHCGWLGTCIGQKNHKAFLFFNWYAFVMASLTLNECWAAMSSTSEQQAAWQEVVKAEPHGHFNKHFHHMFDFSGWFRHAAIPHVILFTFAFFWQTFLCHNIGFCSGEIYFVAEAVPLRCGKRAKDKLCGFQFWCTVFGVICWQSAMGIYRAAQAAPITSELKAASLVFALSAIICMIWGFFSYESTLLICNDTSRKEKLNAKKEGRAPRRLHDRPSNWSQRFANLWAFIAAPTDGPEVLWSRKMGCNHVDARWAKDSSGAPVLGSRAKTRDAIV